MRRRDDCDRVAEDLQTEIVRLRGVITNAVYRIDVGLSRRDDPVDVCRDARNALTGASTAHHVTRERR